jgi:YVTN family beta-propeller protein
MRRSFALAAGVVLSAAALTGGSGAVSSPQLVARIDARGVKPCGSAVYGKCLFANYASFKVTARMRVGDRPWDVAYGFGAVWSSNFRAGTVSRIDPRRRRVVRTIRTSGNPACIRTGAGSVWVGSQGTDQIFRIDPQTNRVTPITIGKGGSVCVDVHDDGVWVSNEVDGSVSRVDPATNRVVANVRVGPAPADGVRGPDGLEWIPNQGDGTVSLLDPASNTVVATVHSGGLPFVVRVGFGSLWVDDFTGRTLSRFTPAA